MINYYDILKIPSDSDNIKIKNAYKKLALKYHPDKNNGNSEKFKEILEAYEILSDENKKYEYDMKLKYSFFDKFNLYNLNQNDYELIEKILNSGEVRLIKLLYKTLPNFIKKNFNKYFENFYNEYKDEDEDEDNNYNIVKSEKFIDISELYENFTIDLLISLEDIYNNNLKIIYIKTKTYICYLYIRKFDNLVILNQNYNLYINFKVNSKNKMYKLNNDLYYIENINIYELYFGKEINILLPNNKKINYKVNDFLNKKYSLINNLGFDNGNLIILYNIVFNNISTSHKSIINEIFNKSI